MNFISVIIVLILFLFEYISVQDSNPDTYTAALISYHGIQGSTAEKIRQNTEKYIEILDNIDQRLDIIIYPEATLDDGLFEVGDVQLFTTVPPPEEQATPCRATDDYYPEFFKKLSCAARHHHVYMVVNLIEKEACDPKGEHCAKYGYNLYNTNVMFNRRGMIVARYRKYHLFGEHPKNSTAKPEIITVTTDFGVTFGFFTCFDILFQKPPLELVKQGIKHIIFPTMWFSELPFLTALQTQQMWAEGNNVTLLASGANNPKIGSGGSGIYAGINGPLILNITTADETFVMVKEIPKEIDGETPIPHKHDSDEVIDELAKELDTFRIIQDEVHKYKSSVIATESSEKTKVICSNQGNDQICCNFKYKTKLDKTQIKSDKNHYTYHMVAFSGERSFAGIADAGVEICSILACLDSNLTSCARRFEKYTDITWPLTFEYIKVEASFSNIETKYQFPNSLLSSLRPIDPSITTWESELTEGSKKILRRHHLNVPQSRLLTFGIWGRNFVKDHVIPGVKEANFKKDESTS